MEQNVLVIQLRTGKIICKRDLQDDIQSSDSFVKLIDPCEVIGIPLSLLPLAYFTGATSIYIDVEEIIWSAVVSEDIKTAYKKTLQDYKLKGGKTEESDIIVPEVGRIVLK